MGYDLKMRVWRGDQEGGDLADYTVSTVDAGGFTLARVVTQTGRKHQIGIHLSHVGHPIVGDKLYGGDENLYLSFVKGE